MTHPTGFKARIFSTVEWLKSFRIVKFGLVGASGTVVNLLVLHLGHEYLFQSFEASWGKPYASLALAIAIATLNNFTWNRLWTWSDRVKSQAMTSASTNTTMLRQFGKYATASWFGSLLQYGLTIWLSQWVHYLLANLTAIAIASVSNFLANDRWTFKKR
ncbi:GtrA family protein [Rhodoferax aquaticus]|uniref:GtrA family protein n=1 Tax=Rhodoferax aquaticus TaxID=2527691 RepID=A0A515ET06_9BURK|nr:GtrA family protein [Rhodoferax aquaticus]QDL55807.1 GtrA family protein [Rhodoferax aquaticus]